MHVFKAMRTQRRWRARERSISCKGAGRSISSSQFAQDLPSFPLSIAYARKHVSPDKLEQQVTLACVMH